MEEKRWRREEVVVGSQAGGGGDWFSGWRRWWWWRLGLRVEEVEVGSQGGGGGGGWVSGWRRQRGLRHRQLLGEVVEAGDVIHTALTHHAGQLAVHLSHSRTPTLTSH